MSVKKKILASIRIKESKKITSHMREFSFSLMNSSRNYYPGVVDQFSILPNPKCVAQEFPQKCTSNWTFYEISGIEFSMIMKNGKLFENSLRIVLPHQLFAANLILILTL